MKAVYIMGAATLCAIGGLSRGAPAPEQFAVYDVCKGIVGTPTYSYQSATGDFLIRCPRETEPRITIKKCQGKLSFDASYNVLVTCPDGRKIPIIRGSYPR